MNRFLIALFVLATAFPCSGQTVDPTTRIVVHTTADLDRNWFVTNWTIGNIKADTPNNINLFPGVGYRFSDQTWLEAMVQRQWSRAGNQWMLDFRLQSQLSDRVLLYAEGAPFLSKQAFYEFVFVDVRVWKKLSLGAETENVHKVGKDSVSAGPRLSFPLASIGEYKLGLGATYQFRMKEPDVPRLYVVLNRRFKK